MVQQSLDVATCLVCFWEKAVTLEGLWLEGYIDADSHWVSAATTLRTRLSTPNCLHPMIEGNGV
jgi:hypothetical protein